MKNNNMYELYMNAYYNTLQEYVNHPEQDMKPVIVKLIVYAVKAINCNRAREVTTMEEAEKEFQFVEVIKDFMGTLTPREFMNIFPIVKEYNGHKWQMKDYFYTRDYIMGLEQDKPIGAEILNFMWEYQNWEITEFNVYVMECISTLRRFNGQPGLFEEFAEEMSLETYTMHTDEKGKEYLIDGNGKTVRVKKPRPKYLKVIK